MRGQTHQTVTVEEIASDEKGAIAIGPFGSAMKADLYVDTGVPVIRGSNIGQGRSFKGNFVFVSDETALRLKRSLLEFNDIFFPHRGAIGEVGIIGNESPNPILMSSSLMRLRVDKKKADAEFVFWFFKSGIGRQEILTYASTVGTPGIGQPLTSLRAMHLSLPPLVEQREIAAILGALDDKIEVNRKASATLEAMARALYRSWFVDFDPVWAKLEGRAPAHMPPATAALFPDSFDDNGLPLGWSFGTLAGVASQSRQSVKPDQISPETPYIGLEHMPRKSIALPDWGTAADIGSQKSSIAAGEFLFGKLRPYFHKVGIAPVDGICSTDIIVIRPNAPDWAGFVLSVISSDEFVEHTNAGSSGTRMPRTNWSDMAAYGMPLPPDTVAAAFEMIVKPWRDRIVSGIHENRTLAALRDSLLPKLMSGEIRVGDARAQAEDVA